MNAAERLQLGWGRRLPMVLQTEAAECGLACLAMVASYFGYQADPAELRRRFGLSLKGATLKDLVRIADQLGSRVAAGPARARRAPAAQGALHPALGPEPFRRAEERQRQRRDHPRPRRRRAPLPLAEVSKHFTGVALELTPTGGFEPAAAPPRVRIGALLGRLDGVKRALGQLLAWRLPSRSSR